MSLIENNAPTVTIRQTLSGYSVTQGARVKYYHYFSDAKTKALEWTDYDYDKIKYVNIKGIDNGTR